MKIKIYKNFKKQTVLLFILISSFVFSQVTYVSNPTNAQINLSLIGDNVTLTNPNLVNGVRATQVATFTNGANAGLEMTKGVFFGTGLNDQLLIANNSLHRDDSPSGTTTTFTDTDLNGISTQNKYDMVTYTFSVTTGPKATTLNIKYQFGSEEYPDYVGTRFNDAFGFFVSGGNLATTQNIGRLPNGQPTSINKVNFGFPGALQTAANTDTSFDGSQAALYIRNGHPSTVVNGKLVTNDNSVNPKPVIVQFNGITKLITYTLSGLLPNTTYNFKIVIADLGDSNYDSGVFVNTIYGTATLVANNDAYSIISGNNSATSVLLNDTVNGAANASLSDVTLSQVSTSNSGVNLNAATGLINVAPGTPPGVYTVNYRICDLTYLENCKTAVATVTVLANDPDGDGIDNFTDLDDDNDGILDTVEGLCATTGFEGFETNPLQPNVNGNNIQTGLTYNGWSVDGMTPTAVPNPFNIVRVDNTTYSSGPASAQAGSQYLDINATGGNLYREFTLTTPTVLNASVFFSPRETSGTTIVFQSKIELIKLSGTSQTWSGNVINYNSVSPYVWTQSSLNNIVLPAGTYRLQMFIHNNAHVDSISYCFSTDTDGDGTPDYLDTDSDNDGCPDVIEGAANFQNGASYITGNRLNTTVNSNGVPAVPTGVTPAITNYTQSGGQAIGTSQNASLQDVQCANALGCTNALYLSQSATLYNVNTSTNPFTYPTLGTASSNYNAIGLNPLDGRLYGMQVTNSNNVLVINPNGTSINLGPVTGLPTGVTFNAGEIDNLGNYYVKVNTDNAELYRINLSTMTATLITLSASVNLPDIAFRTTNGFLYGVNSTNGQLVSINLATGTVTGIGIAPGAVNFGAMFASSTGEMYGVDNAGGFYQFNLVNGQRVLVSNAPASSANDGAHCVTAPIAFSADLAITKTDNTTTYTPGATTTYTIVASNNGPFGVLGATVSDPLPTGISAANVSYSAVVAGGAVTSVSGTQTGAINDVINLPVNGTVTYTVTVNVPLTFTGNLVNTVTITAPANSTDSNTANNTATDTDTQAVCYRPGINTGGTVLDTNHGITSLARAGSIAPGNWPMVRKGAWTALESRTKGFVVNRLTTQEIAQIPAANLVEGMMVYNVTLDCLQVNTTGTPAGWACFNTPTCPSN